MEFEQGDLIELNFEAAGGNGPGRLRPALVVSVGYFNNVVSKLVVVCPITSQSSDYPLHVELPPDGSVQGAVCVEQLRALDLADSERNVSKVGASVSYETMVRVLEAIGAVFGI